MKENNDAGTIDSTDNLKYAAIYLVDGTEDHTAPVVAVDAVDDFYTTEDVQNIDYVKLPIKHDPKGS